MRLTKEEKLKALRIVLGNLKVNKSHNCYAICGELGFVVKYKIRPSLEWCSHKEARELFNLEKHRPESVVDKYINDIWWPQNEEGHAERIRIVRLLIKEFSSKIANGKKEKGRTSTKHSTARTIKQRGSLPKRKGSKK